MTAHKANSALTERPGSCFSALSLGAVAAVLLALGLAPATPAAAEEQQAAVPAASDTLSDSPLLSAESVAERRCLVEASDIGRLITIHTGRWPEDTGFSTDYEEIVKACQEGRYAAARDMQAVIWAALTLHLPHKS